MLFGGNRTPVVCEVVDSAYVYRWKILKLLQTVAAEKNRYA